MCGICGWLSPSGIDPRHIVAMSRRAKHRGPDGEGYYVRQAGRALGSFVGRADAEGIHGLATIALGHVRLAILDLSDAGIQPMATPDRKVWLTFNGEIYNYIELRDELKDKGHVFRTATDTEVILAAYSEWGTGCFSKFNGMWGLAIVDFQRGVLILSRDRLGIKPLYTWENQKTLAFASEIKQFPAIPEFHARAEIKSLVEYVDTGYEWGPATFFEDVKALPPGTWCESPLESPQLGAHVPYWRPEEVGLTSPTRAEAEERTRELFEDSVRLRLRSDVPVGVCLSGGLDSSAVFSQMQHLKDGAAQDTFAFTAYYDDPQFDEQPYADIVLRSVGGQGFMAPVQAGQFLEDLDRFIYHHDEPPGALSQYAAWSVMRVAREHGVSVLLNGQGGDELFTGYWPAYYLYLKQLRSPVELGRHLLGSIMPGGNPELVRQIVPHVRQYVHRRRHHSSEVLNEKLCDLAQTDGHDWAATAQQLAPAQYRMSEIRNIHLPRLLKWDDRNSMAFSIEGRYPFLDFRLVEWAAALSPALNLSRGWNKLLLRTALAHLLPHEIQWRRSKVGFVTPQTVWLRTALQPVLNEWLTSPVPQLLEVVDRTTLMQLSNRIFHRKSLHIMDEEQFLLVRLFFLDRWFRVFNVSV